MISVDTEGKQTLRFERQEQVDKIGVLFEQHFIFPAKEMRLKMFQADNAESVHTKETKSAVTPT